MKQTTKSLNTTYASWIHRGPRFKKDEKTYVPRVGAVVATVEGTTLKIGWSLCNQKDTNIPTLGIYVAGDRFDPEHAMSLAEGRARLQNKNSLTFNKGAAPTTRELMRKGVPQSALSAMKQVVQQALADHSDIRKVIIFSKKTEKVESTPEKVW